MANNKGEALNVGSVGDRIRSIAYAWDSLDDAVAGSPHNCGYVIRGIKLLPRGSEWLIIIQGVIEDRGFVQFKTATSSGDLGKMIRAALETDDWKPDKFYGLDKK